MKAKLVRTLVAAPILALSALAFAEAPVQLSPAEMDGVTAGGVADALAVAAAAGRFLAATATSTLASVTVVQSIPFQATTINYVLGVAGAASTSVSQ